MLRSFDVADSVSSGSSSVAILRAIAARTNDAADIARYGDAVRREEDSLALLLRAFHPGPLGASILAQATLLEQTSANLRGVTEAMRFSLAKIALDQAKARECDRLALELLCLESDDPRAVALLRVDEAALEADASVLRARVVLTRSTAVAAVERAMVRGDDAAANRLQLAITTAADVASATSNSLTQCLETQVLLLQVAVRALYVADKHSWATAEVFRASFLERCRTALPGCPPDIFALDIIDEAVAATRSKTRPSASS